MLAVGIDLGTTNSIASVFKDDGTIEIVKTASGRELLASAVSLTNDNAVIVGAAAKARQLQYPQKTVTAFKRAIGTDKVFKLGKSAFSAVDLSSLVLKELLMQIEEQYEASIEHLVITVPAYFNSIQREQTLQAASLAGVEANRLINEPTAAALAYGLHDKEDESTFMVLDLGGGTFDVSILEMFEGVMEVRASSGDAFLGGEDFTAALAKHLAQKLDQTYENLSANDVEPFIFAAEQIKQGLSQRHSVSANIVFKKKSHTVEVTREEFEEVCTALTRRLRRPIEKAIYDAKLDPSEIDRILLVGGSTRMPLVRALAVKLFQKLPERTLDPDLVVAMGAAVQAGLCQKNKALEDVVMTDVSPFSLGIESRNETAHGVINGAFVPILERNTTLPASRSQMFSTVSNNQSYIKINVLQGEAPLAKDNIKLGDLSISVPPAPAGHEGVDVRFSYDVSGLLQVDVTALSTNETKEITIEGSGKTLDPNLKRESLKRLGKLKVHPREQLENQEILEQLNELYAMHLGEDREAVQGVIAEFMTVLDTQDPTKISRIRPGIRKKIEQMKQSYAF